MTEIDYLKGEFNESIERRNKETSELLDRIAGLRKGLQDERKKVDDLWKESESLRREVVYLRAKVAKLEGEAHLVAMDPERAAAIRATIEGEEGRR